MTVQEGSGFPPFAIAASRTLCVSLILFGLALAFKQGLRVSGPQLQVLFVSGILLWLGGNGLVVWAERQADSGYAALVVGTTPMWPVTLEAFLDRCRQEGYAEDSGKMHPQIQALAAPVFG